MTVTLKRQCKQVDRQGYLEYLEQFPDQVQTADEIGRRCPDVGDVACESVLVCGMGGSGIAGDVLSRIGFRQLRVPLVSNKSYNVPSWVDETTVVMLVSYSGSTEETLSCYHEARKRNAHPVVLTSNGELEVHARENGVPVITIPPDLPPRASAGYLLLPALHLLSRLDLVPGPDREDVIKTSEALVRLVDECSPEREENRAVERARDLQGSLPLLIGSEPFTACLAYRFRNQINENAKAMAVACELPEIHHNQIMAWDHLAGFSAPGATGIFLRDREEHPRVQERFRLTRQRLEEREISVHEIQGSGNSSLSRFLTLMLYTDFISYYLAVLRGEDPNDVSSIDQLKNELNKAGS